MLLEIKSIFYICLSIAEMIGLLIFPFVAKKFGRDTTYKIACLVPVLGLSILGFQLYLCQQVLFY